jgi:hypothetical protein
MSRHDFVAITNGCAFVSILFSLFTIPFFAYFKNLQEKILELYILHNSLFTVFVIALVIIALYLIGLSLSGLYAKYKRCNTIGISPWKIILSMPFAFFMLWTPGYLIEEKTKKSNLEIKSQWYSKFNNWVLSSVNNTLFVFLFIVLFKSLVAGVATLVLTTTLFVLYTLWYVKHKSDFIKNINNGYALTAVGINIAIILAVLSQAI